MVANNLLMLGLSYFRHKLFEFQAFLNQAHIINFTGIIIYFCGRDYLYAQNGGVDSPVMCFHFRASIKRVFKNFIFSIVLEAFYLLYEAKISNRSLSVVYVSWHWNFPGVWGTIPRKRKRKEKMGHPMKHGLNQYFSDNAGITSQWIFLAAMKSWNNFPCLRGLQLLIKCCSGITPLMHCILTNRCPMLFSFQS